MCGTYAFSDSVRLPVASVVSKGIGLSSIEILSLTWSNTLSFSDSSDCSFTCSNTVYSVHPDSRRQQRCNDFQITDKVSTRVTMGRAT
eukprot:CCRYP_003716-RA/>CCRYP_003716-RA protein AED:0.02 eAED:0.02 QI:769/0/1/1/0/0/2/2782/87